MTARVPIFRVEVNGEPLFEPGDPRLKSIQITDRDGTRSDTLDLELDDGPGRFLSIPDARAEFRVWGGYRDAPLLYFGRYRDADVTVQCLPWGVSISAKAADFKSDLKTKQERHWDGRTVAEILRELAAENGLTAVIDPTLGAVRLDYAAMTNESLLAFGKRLAGKIGGRFSIKDGRLILIAQGRGASATGRALPPLVIERPRILTARAEFGGRDAVGVVEAEWTDRDGAKRQTVRIIAKKGAKGTHRLTETYASEAEARRAATAQAAALTASSERTSVTIEGDPAVRAAMPMTYAGLRPGLDGRRFVIESATHNFDPSAGYTTDIEAKAETTALVKDAPPAGPVQGPPTAGESEPIP